MARSKELREKRAELHEKMKAIDKKATDEKRKLSADETQEWDRLDKEITDLGAEVVRLEKHEALDRELAESRNTPPKPPTPLPGAGDGNRADPAAETSEIEKSCFRAWLSGWEMTPEQRAFAATRNASLPPEARAQAAGTAAAGGYLVPQSFSNRLEKALKFYGPMMQAAEIIPTDTGADMPWPTVNDTGQVGAILAENVAISPQDVTFSSVTLKAYMYTSKLIAVSWQLLQDSFFDVEGLIADLAGERLGRILNTHFTTGSGASQPNGIQTAAAAGKVGTAGQTTSIIYDDIVDLAYSVDPAYRPASSFQANDATIGAIRKLKDSQNRPLWEPSVQAGQPDRILNYTLVANNDLPVMAANAKSLLFGDFKRYKVRRVRDVTMVRLNERYADALQTGFFAFARFDGNLVNAGTNPVKYYQNSAT